MKDKEIEQIIAYAFLTNKHKWVSISGLSRNTGLPQAKVKTFVEHSDLVTRAKTKNKKGEILYTLTEKGRGRYQLDKTTPKDIFAKTKQFLLDGRLKEAIGEYFDILKDGNSPLPDNLQALYKSNLVDLSTAYYQLEEYWKQDKVTSEERFTATDRFIYRLYESILELEVLIKALEKYRYKFKHVTIRIEQRFDSFSKTDENQVLDSLADLMQLPRADMMVKSIEQGSVMMTLEFESSEQAEQLYLLIKLGRLKSEGISDARLKMLSEKTNIPSPDSASEVTEICRKAKKLIQKGKAEKVIDFLLEHLEIIGERFQNRLLLLSSDMSALIEKSNLGLERVDEIRIIRNKITYSLLELIDEIKKQVLN